MPLAGELIRASDVIQDDWTTYTPTWSAVTTAPVLGNGTLDGAYMQVGDIVFWAVTLTTGSTSTYGSGPWLFSLPVTPELDSVFPAVVFDSSANQRFCAVGVITSAAASGNNMRILVDQGAGTAVGASVPFTWATGDKLSIRAFVRPA
jgi:hypothetical protein